ncbi:hypothetical protein ACFXPZ_39575 [Streptomyces sp. NPDC059101]|uniref:hypothetical protein n=1 Tax=Streptomyces sp. NPDC059101 TaxID=3346728 RepID=UPI0036A9ACB7
MTGRGTHRATGARFTKEAVDAAVKDLRAELDALRVHLPELGTTDGRITLGTIGPGTAERLVHVLRRGRRRRWVTGDGWIIGSMLALVVGVATVLVVSLLVAR